MQNCRLRERLFGVWRVCATGVAFVTFMSGGLLFALLVFPILRILPGSQARKQRRVLATIHLLFRLFIRYLMWLKIMEAFDVVGLDGLDSTQPHLFIANHPTLIDIVAINSCLPCCNCIVKRELWRHFYLGGVMRSAGYIPNDHATQFIEDCRLNFQQGRSLIVFPEGTRSPAHGLRPYHRGAAQIALRTGVAVVPVVITCHPPTLMKNQPWYKIPLRPFRIRIHFHLPMRPPPDVLAHANLPAQVRSLTRHFEAFFRKELGLLGAIQGGNKDVDG